MDLLDLLIKNAVLIDRPSPVDIACQNGRILQVDPHIQAQAETEIDAEQQLVTAPFVDSHFHMDSTLSYGRPRVNQSGTLLEGMRTLNSAPSLCVAGLWLREILLFAVTWTSAIRN